jgi:hypothetical protein
MVLEAAAAHKAVSEQYSIIGGTFRSQRHSSLALGTAVTQAEKAPETHTSRFIQGVLEMMKLQAPLHDTDKDPAMAAEAALRDEYNFITGEGLHANHTPSFKALRRASVQRRGLRKSSAAKCG